MTMLPLRNIYCYSICLCCAWRSATLGAGRKGLRMWQSLRSMVENLVRPQRERGYVTRWSVASAGIGLSATAGSRVRAGAPVGLRSRGMLPIAGGALLVAAFVLLQGCAGPGSRSAEGSGAMVPSAVDAESSGSPASLDADYRIGANDLLEIGVLGVADLNRTVRVNSSGSVSMPLIGMIHIAGLTSSEAEALLETEYEKEYLQDPQISVFIKEFTSQRFTVDGAVSKPGVYPLVGNMTLLRAIATAGGKGDLADLENVMLFRVAKDGTVEKMRYDVLKIRTGEEPDPVLRRDDVVVVNRDPSRVPLRDSLFRDILDTLIPF